MNYLNMLDRLLELAEEEGSTGLSTGRLEHSQEYQELYDQLFDVLLSIKE